MTSTEYLLTCLAEECNKVARRASKSLRFGGDETTARAALDAKQASVRACMAAALKETP